MLKLIGVLNDLNELVKLNEIKVNFSLPLSAPSSIVVLNVVQTVEEHLKNGSTFE